MTDLALTGNNLLAIVATSLLVFVSGGVIYLSTIEWRDRLSTKAVSKARR